MARNLPRNVRIAGRRTSMRLEQPYWEALAEIARREGADIDSVCTMIAEKRRGGGLSSAVRIEVMLYFRERLAQLDAFAQATLAKQSAAPAPQRRARGAGKPRPPAPEDTPRPASPPTGSTKP
ncbi:MAG: ribbon-helix-helix domain-containing protein [Alphaproteobacteria bacterium]|nr:ribbon-helix-helix domain-containing protein [Alphaproteobacteria bacterium]